ncbi:MAG: hypothetical protein ACREOM_13285 [Candidatus Dormibacteraceae bacterium]
MPERDARMWAVPPQPDRLQGPREIRLRDDGWVPRSATSAIRIGIAAGVLLFRLPTLTEPAWYSDDGFFMTVSWLTTQGLKLYSGVYDNSPPGIYWLYRLLLEMGARDNHFVVQSAAAAAVIVVAMLTFEVARRIAPLWPAALAGGLTGLVLSLPVLDGDVFNVEIAGLPFFMAALVLAFNPGRTAALASGVLLGAAITIRPSYALDGLAIVLVLVTTGPLLARAAAATVGLAAAGLAVTIALWATGSLVAYLDTVLPSDHGYMVWANGGSLIPLYIRLAALGAVGLVGLARSRTLQGRLLAAWIPASIAGASLTPRELTHYVHEAIPPLAVGISLLAVRVRWSPLAAPIAALALVAAAEAVLVLPAQETATVQRTGAPAPFLHNFAYAGLPAYYANWLAFAAGARDRSAYDAWFPGRASLDVAELQSLRQPAQPVRIIVVGDRPWLYVKGGVLPATPFIATNSAFWQVSWGRAAIARAVGAGCADFVVYIDAEPDWSRQLQSDAYVRVQGAPWVTYKPLHRSLACG